MIRVNVCVLGAVALGWSLASGAEVPRAEHPTPDAVRDHWASLNGNWQFRFDPKDEGRKSQWSEPDAKGFDQTIVVPFGWESALSGIEKPEYQGVAWYRRTFRVPDDFPKAGRVWLRFGAVDWLADVWVNGKHVATHEGGYSPFAADITDALKPGEPATVVVRAFDPTDPDLPTGKQIGWYTHTSGIWQTVWLEARPKARVDRFTIRTAIDPARATFLVETAGLPKGKSTVTVRSNDPTVATATTTIDVKEEDGETCCGADGGPSPNQAKVEVSVKEPKLWSPESPHLYDVTIELKTPDGKTDAVKTYFGLRTIARGRFGEAPYERLLLNGKPIYLRSALDQSFNPKGVYTGPSDEFLRKDIELAKSLGLNGLRIHIKPDEPRRLYWADKLGLLILEDMPNTWRQNKKARKAWEKTMREVVARDRNHPAIVAWVAFNETWGLGSPPEYKADRDTQQWVGAMVDAIRKLDPTRLVEDNSPCNNDHVENNDLNSWHFYIDDHDAARRHVDEVVARTEPGSGFNYCPGQKQGTAPLINSEYGAVSAGGGDRDVSWGFRDLTTLLRRQPKVQGYVYTELSDIEWEHNGFVDYNRAPKVFGYDAFVPGMTVADLQGADFVGYDGPPAIVAAPGSEISVPLFVSHYSDRKEAPRLRWTLTETFNFGAVQTVTDTSSDPIAWKAFDVTALPTLKVRVPSEPCVGALGLELVDRDGKRIAANFVNVVVKGDEAQPRVERAKGEKNAAVVRFRPDEFARRAWSGKMATLPGKVSGQGRGFFEYRLKLPEAIVKAEPKEITLWVEAGSRAGKAKVDWASRPNDQDYPQTDARKWPSTVRLSLNGHKIESHELPDDPADARGVLSHLARVDHGSHGELVALGGPLPKAVVADLKAGKPLVVRLAVPDDARQPGGLALYGASMGAYPSDPTLVIRTKDPLPDDLGADPDRSAAIDTFASKQIVLIAAGDAPKPSTWAYTTTRPGDPKFSLLEFDDKDWKHGPAGFGTFGTPAIRVRTDWNSPDIWLRTTVELPRLARNDALTLHLFHDEDVEVFVNGRRLFQEGGFLKEYRDVALSEEQKALFQAGKNVVTVHCRQSSGGQGVDLGLILFRE